MYNKKDRYFHIIKSHKKDIFNKEGIRNIVNTLINPDEKYRTKDRNGVSGYCFLSKQLDEEILAVIVRKKYNNCILSYA